MKIVVCGSLAYDRIMDFPGYFSDHILPDKISLLNVSFQVDSITEKFGGTAGNIAYALTLLGERPVISATVGQDYSRYFTWLESHGISTQCIKIIPEEFTASCYITTDRRNNQIISFHSGSMKYSSSLDFDQLSPQDTLMIISPGNSADMVNYSLACQSRGIDYIFDPGQQIPMLDPEGLIRSITGCRILICNDYELNLILNKTGLRKADLLKLTQTIITTLGDRGSLITTSDKEVLVPCSKPRRVVDPTGVGDSYRGGLISGLIRGFSIERSAKLGSVCASFCIESCGTQEYCFSPEEFNQRLETG
jgi:adenosine kinase